MGEEGRGRENKGNERSKTKSKKTKKRKEEEKKNVIERKKSNLRYSRTYVIIVPAREFLTASWEKRAKEERKKNED